MVNFPPWELTLESSGRSSDVKAFGSVSFRSTPERNPWLCSLKERGFRGRHRCGVTMLSGPPKQTILLSSAHCNYVCRDSKTDFILEICCCRNKTNQASCRKDSLNNPSSYCPTDAKLVKAKPSDMLIVCGEDNIDVKPEKFSDEFEIVLTITRIINHPDYEPDRYDPDEFLPKGPYAGNDIAVYQVDDSPLKYEDKTSRLKRKELYPACLPKETYPAAKPKRGIFAGWLDPEPYYRVDEERDLETYRRNYLFTRQVQLEEVLCRDPSWMNSNTYYPPGTVCYRDPSMTTCLLFGNSGSGVVRPFATIDGTERYSLVGPLSMSKGCDLALVGEDRTITYAAENPGVFTNAICYLDWIANQYGLRMPDGFRKPESCTKGRGDKYDLNKRFCRASGDYIRNGQTLPKQSTRFTYCDFTQIDDKTNKPWDRCQLLAQEGFAYNMYQCKDRFNQTVICANNCKGVDPNAVVVGGTALFAAAAFSGVGFFTQALPVGVGLAVAGGAVALGVCPPIFCRVGNRCCLLVSVNNRLQCPRNC